jgi:hypothetical protein
MKAWPRISTCLPKPICAEGLNGTCQKDDSETRDEQDHSFHLRPPELDQLRHRDNRFGDHAKPTVRALAGAPAHEAYRRRERRSEVTDSGDAAAQVAKPDVGGPRALK